MSSFLPSNGPNLNLLGSREPDVYGATRLEDIETQAVAAAGSMGHDLACFQSNAEHELIDRVHQAAVDEEFRQINYFSDIANSCLFGFGAYGYQLALEAANRCVATAEDK